MLALLPALPALVGAIVCQMRFWRKGLETAKAGDLRGWPARETHKPARAIRRKLAFGVAFVRFFRLGRALVDPNLYYVILFGVVLDERHMQQFRNNRKFRLRLALI